MAGASFMLLWLCGRPPAFQCLPMGLGYVAYRGTVMLAEDGQVGSIIYLSVLFWDLEWE